MPENTRVTYQVGFTRNMDNYESLRIDVGVEGDPSTGEDTALTYERLKTFVDDRLFDAIAQVEEDIVEIRKGIRAGKEYKRKVTQAAKEEEKGS